MAQIRGGYGTGIRGKAGSLVFSEWKGIQILKTVPIRSKDSWSERQKLHRQRFKAINDYCRKYKFSLIPEIWNPAAENGHGYNLFLQANTPAFALDGMLSDQSKLHFSDGKLPLPLQFKAVRMDSDHSKVNVSWQNDENLHQMYEHDRLMMVAGYTDHFSTPSDTAIQRKDGQGIISFQADYEDITGIWLFFANTDKKAYSPDQYFGI